MAEQSGGPQWYSVRIAYYDCVNKKCPACGHVVAICTTDVRNCDVREDDLEVISRSEE